MQQSLRHRNLILLYIFSGCVSFTFFSCSKADQGPINPPSPVAALLSFSFQRGVNNIPVNSTATINGTTVSIFLPPGTSTDSLIANFTLIGNATASVSGVVQQTGVTANDFTKSVKYVITEKDGSTQSYFVNLVTGINAVDEQVAAFMSKYNVPGLTIAIAKDDRLVYSQAYGFADKKNAIPATTSTLFRLASDSKQFTAVAMMRLLDLGKINMTDKIFGTGSVLGTTYGTPPYGTGVTSITVSDLLHHTSGGWGTGGNQYNKFNDPIFSNLTLNHAELLNWTLDNVPLDTVPGTHFNYSNFGYFLLARVIEKITGENYKQAVQDLVLTPCGITDMHIAGNSLAQRLPNEAVYYSQETQQPYSGMNIHRADGCAGWIATSTDLVKLTTHINQLHSSSDIISLSTFKIMTGTTPFSNGYACGWGVYPDNEGFEHEGALPGTSSDQAFATQLMNPANPGNYSFGIVINTRTLDAGYGGDLDNIFWTAQQYVTAWPTYDLFNPDK